MVKAASKNLKDLFYNLRFERKFIYIGQDVDDIIKTVVINSVSERFIIGGGLTVCILTITTERSTQ